MANKVVEIGKNGASLMSMRVHGDKLGGFTGVEIHDRDIEFGQSVILTPNEFRELLSKGHEMLSILEGDC